VRVIIRDGRDAFIGSQSLRKLELDQRREVGVFEKFHLDPQATAAIPLTANSSASPGNAAWDGVALAFVLPKAMLALRQ
jgi:hypothetical protein